MVELVLRKNVKVQRRESLGYFTYVVIGFSFEGTEHIECHYFCLEKDLEKIMQEAKFYDDSKVTVMNIMEYIEEGYAYLKVS